MWNMVMGPSKQSFIIRNTNDWICTFRGIYPHERLCTHLYIYANWNTLTQINHTSYLSRAPRAATVYIFFARCKFLQIEREKLAIHCVNFGVNFILQKFWLCKKNDKYEVWFDPCVLTEANEQWPNRMLIWDTHPIPKRIGPFLVKLSRFW